MTAQGAGPTIAVVPEVFARGEVSRKGARLLTTEQLEEGCLA